MKSEIPRIKVLSAYENNDIDSTPIIVLST